LLLKEKDVIQMRTLIVFISVLAVAIIGHIILAIMGVNNDYVLNTFRIMMVMIFLILSRPSYLTPEKSK
jgi:hypothetical protein